jgi:hypothetical protein
MWVAPDSETDLEVEHIAAVLHDQYKLDRVAPGHWEANPRWEIEAIWWRERASQD